MLQNLLYVAAPKQSLLVRQALDRMGATPIVAQAGVPSQPGHYSAELAHPLLGKMVLQIDVVDNIDIITPHLKQHAVDLLIYDERGGMEARAALSRIKADVAAFAELWGPDFVFPMSRVVAILGTVHNDAQRAFELGRIGARDVCVAPENTAQVLRFLARVLRHGILREPRIGMAMSGGGLEGFLYQVGVLRALERAMTGRSLHGCHVYSGVSSGAIASALLAGGIEVGETIRALHRRSDRLGPIGSNMLFDVAGWNILRRIVGESMTWSGLSPQKLINQTLRSIPTGLFKGDQLEDYFKRALEKEGKGNRFEDLDAELYLGATDQDSFEHVVFGKAPWENVPISAAIRASVALPPIFLPKQINGRYFIDGQVTRTCNLELVIERGCRLVMIIDPIRPYGSGLPGTVDGHGGVFGMIQVIKALVYSRFQLVLSHAAERYPDVDFIVFQPDEECAKIMSGSPMRYKIRTQLIELAYISTLRKLRERHQVYAAKLSRYGFTLATADRLHELEMDTAEIASGPPQ